MLQSAISATNVATVATILAPSFRASYAKHPVPLLPPGTSITLDTAHATTSSTAADVVVVPATLAGAHPGKWFLIVTSIDGQWLLLGTVPA